MWAYRWLWQDLYVPVWPNIVADPICALLAVLYGVVKIKQHINKKQDEATELAAKHHHELLAQAERHQEEIKEHITSHLDSLRKK